MSSPEKQESCMIKPLPSKSTPSGAAKTRTSQPSSVSSSRDKKLAPRDMGGSSSRDDGTCGAHPGEAVTAYCKTCYTLVCLDCLIEAVHSSHKVVKIAEIVQSPDFFAKTFRPLNNLQKAKEKYVKDLQQAELDIKEGHTKQIEDIQGLEKLALDMLTVAYDGEVEMLDADRDMQRDTIRKIAETATVAVTKHQETQVTQVTVERQNVENSLPSLSKLTATLNQTPTEKHVPTMVNAKLKGEEVLSKETAALAVTGVETTADGINGQDMNNFTEMTVCVSRKLETSDIGAQTKDVMAAVPSIKAQDVGAQTIDVTTTAPSIKVQDLRLCAKKILPNTRRDLATYNKENRKIGSVVVCQHYVTTCYNFGFRSSKFLPGCYKEPYLTHPVDVNNDLIFMDPSDAKSLSALFGGKPSLIVQKANKLWCLKNDKGSIVSYYVWLHDKTGKVLTFKTTEGKDISGFTFLPASSNLYCALDEYLGWWPSEVKDMRGKQTVSSMVTVNEWSHTATTKNLIVIP